MDANRIRDRFSVDDSLDDTSEAFEIALEYCFTFDNRNEATFECIYNSIAYVYVDDVAIKTFELIIQAR